MSSCPFHQKIIEVNTNRRGTSIKRSSHLYYFQEQYSGADNGNPNSSSTSTFSNELVPALRLVLSSDSFFERTLLLAPFWLEITLSYLDEFTWIMMETISRSLNHNMKESRAWQNLDLGSFAPRSISRKRKEVIRRRETSIKMKTAWAAIEAFALPGVSWTLNSGLVEGEIRKLEYELGPNAYLPADLRASFGIHNGQSFISEPGLLGGGRLLTLQEVTKEVRRQNRLIHENATAADEEGSTPPFVTDGQQLCLPSTAAKNTVVALPLRMVPLTEGARGRSICIALPLPTLDSKDEEEYMEGVGAIYLVTALSCRKLSDSWLDYLGTIR